MKLDLAEEEREAVLQLVEEAVRESKYPLSPETEALRAVADKLRGEDKPRRR
jgi:hypothetical protein